MERPHCAPQRSSTKHVSEVSSSTSLISSCTTPSACGGAGFSHFGLCVNHRYLNSQHIVSSLDVPRSLITHNSCGTNASTATGTGAPRLGFSTHAWSRYCSCEACLNCVIAGSQTVGGPMRR